MKTQPKRPWYVATLAHYVLIEADDAETARRDAVPELKKLSARGEIRTVRPATDDEIEICQWHAEMTAAESYP